MSVPIVSPISTRQQNVGISTQTFDLKVGIHRQTFGFTRNGKTAEMYCATATANESEVTAHPRWLYDPASALYRAKVYQSVQAVRSHCLYLKGHLRASFTSLRQRKIGQSARSWTSISVPTSPRCLYTMHMGRGNHHQSGSLRTGNSKRQWQKEEQRFVFLAIKALSGNSTLNASTSRNVDLVCFPQRKLRRSTDWYTIQRKCVLLTIGLSAKGSLVIYLKNTGSPFSE